MIIDNNLRFQEITNNNDASFVCTALALSQKIRTISKPMYFYRKSGTGLQATVRRDPYCVIQARIHTKNELVKRVLWTPQYYMHFANVFYHTMANQLAQSPLSPEELITVRDTLREHFDFSTIRCKEIEDQEAYYLIQALIFGSNEYYLAQLITTLKNYKKESNQHKQKLKICELQLKKSKQKYNRLQKSFSYCLGRKLTWFPRKARDLFYRLKVRFS